MSEGVPGEMVNLQDGEGSLVEIKKYLKVNLLTVL